MIRFADWPTRLNDFIDSRREAVFSWGENDCALFAADAVWAMTGTDLASAYRGRYDDWASSIHALRQLGAGEIEGTATGLLGEPIAAALARRGDVVSVDSPSGPALGICLGARVACLTLRGLRFLPLSAGRKAWRV
jgi:hypothetical protein